MRLLVVEDEARMADLLRRGLVAEGYAVDIVGTAEDGRFMGSENDYDAIVMDVNLPDGDGFDVCRDLRAGRPLEPDHRPDGARGRERSRSRPGRRRRRLPREAVLVRGAGRPAPGPRAPRRRAATQPRPVGAVTSTPRRTPCPIAGVPLT